ncbi:RNA polymerase I-specific transcription initiation factor RRN3 [Porphyridium purpureum]|uniref:RNA polymerase I-specific transcription initiation factor RRN3 n=1 Tax=Porphyridium purpureum TaxID=35688 RepID=A0A5J4YV07_PORPP|nr:RNA polymerase I-specific transcription initiation factor RRN3 [Porphyridium purpureum]|eukprot:POR5007..scf227_4
MAMVTQERPVLDLLLEEDAQVSGLERVEYWRLVHALGKKADADVLLYVAARGARWVAHNGRGVWDELVCAAVDFDFVKAARKQGKLNAASPLAGAAADFALDQLPPAVFESYAVIARAVAAVDARYVEQLFRRITSLFTMIRVGSAHGTLLFASLMQLLEAYPTAAPLLSTIVAQLLPHYRREKSSIISYTEFLTRLICVCRSALVRQHAGLVLTTLVVMMDAEVDHTKTDHAVQPLLFEPDLADKGPSADVSEKLDACLLLVFGMIDSISTQQGYPTACVCSLEECFEIFYAAFELRVMQVDSPHYAVFPLFYVGAQHAVLSFRLLDRLRTGFTNPALAVSLRISHVRFSAAFIALLRNVPHEELDRWLRTMISWSHTYVDTLPDHLEGVLDAEMHSLFYHCFQNIAIVMVGCHTDLFAATDRQQLEKLRALRLASLIRCSINPLRMIESERLVWRFSSLLSQFDILDCSDVLADNEYVVVPSFTKHNKRKNVIRLRFPFPCYLLRESKRHVDALFVCGRAIDETSHVVTLQEQEQSSGRDMDIETDMDHTSIHSHASSAAIDVQRPKGVTSSSSMQNPNKLRLAPISISWDESPASSLPTNNQRATS